MTTLAVQVAGWPTITLVGRQPAVMMLVNFKTDMVAEAVGGALLFASPWYVAWIVEVTALPVVTKTPQAPEESWQVPVDPGGKVTFPEPGEKIIVDPSTE